VQTIINNPGFDGDVQLERDRIFAASIYANALNQPMDVAYQNLDVFHEQWTGQKFVKKTGVQAIVDSLGVSFYSQLLNEYAKEYHNSGQDPTVLKAMQEVTGKLNNLRDNVPKIWQDEYVKQGGWADLLALGRSITTSAAENILPMGMAIGAGALAATGVGAIAGVISLPAGLTGILTSGASMVAMAGTTASQTVGLEYFDLISQGIPDDIAWTNANLSAQIQGVIESIGGGVVSGTTKKIIGAAAPGLAEKAITKWFIKGKMGAGAKMLLDYFQEVAGEAFEEGTQQITSIEFYNRAAEQSNVRRNELLERIYAEPLEELRNELEKELEKHPELDKKEFAEAWKEIKEATIGGLGTALLLGIPGARLGYRSNVESAQALASMAQAAPNETVFKEMVQKAKSEGLNNPFIEGMKTDEQNALLSDIYKVQQERLTPEQREAKQKAIQDASAITEVTDFRNTEIVERKDEETGETIIELAAPDNSNIYQNKDGTLEINEYTDIKEDGSIEGRFVAGDPRIEDKEQTGVNQYGYINYTQNGNNITIDEFRMLKGHENLLQQLYDHFAERFAGMNIELNASWQNLTLREDLVNRNPRGPKAGLNYYEKGNNPNVSNEARQIAARFTPYLKNSTPLETALAVELFNNFYRHRGENLNGAMKRLIGSITNTAPEAVSAAQRKGKFVKGATWFDKTEKGMRHFVYLNKNAADASTVIHETSHIVESDFTEAERNIAIEALDGYKLKNGAVFNNDKNTPFAKWTMEQRETFSEAFAEALENYLTNGNVPDNQIKNLFEKIKEFMKRIYEKMKGWTELSPKVEEFYKSLFSGELVDQARAENSLQTQEEARSEAQTKKTINDTEQAENATEAPQDTARAKSHTTTIDHMKKQANAEREAIINNPDITLKEKTKAVLDAAGEALFQAGEYDQAEIYKKGIGLDKAQANLTSLLDNGKPITLQNSKTGDEAWLSKSSIGKLLSNDAVRKSMGNGFTREQHYAVASDIASLFNNAEKLFNRPDKNNDPNVKIHRYAAPLHFDENVALITIKESVQHGKRIYTAELMEIEKLEGILKEAENTAHFPSSSSAINNLINEIRNVNTNEAGIEGGTLFQLSDEDQEIVDAAKSVYGTTTDFREAGYLLTDGTMLDLSGKKDGGEPGHRYLDHREMNYFEHKGKVYKPGMDGFMSMGNIRLKPEMGGLELTKSPSNEQTGTLRKYIRFNKGDVIIDFSKENLDVENSIEYSGANADRVINDIKNYYEKGELPPEVPILFQTAWNGSTAMFDRFDNYYAGRSSLTKTHGWGHSFYSQREAADWFSKKLEEYKGAASWLYEAKIPDDTELLEWEKSLSDQPEKVKNTAVQLITWNKDGKSNFNEAYNLRKFKDGKYGFFRSINGKMKWASIEEAQTAAKSEIMKALTGEDFYTGIAKTIGEKNTSLLLDSMGVKGIKYLDKTTEKMGLSASHSFTVFGDQAISMTSLLFQTEDRDMMEEAASFDSYKEWQTFTETFYDAPMDYFENEKLTFNEEQIDAWYKTFWENARKAVNSTEEQTGQTKNITGTEKATPAELDKEFNELIEEPHALEDFVETAAALYNEDGRWGAIDEKDAEAAETVRSKLTHPTWQSIFKVQGKIGPQQRKQLLTMIQRSPREYRAIYAAVMEREDLAVSAEDTMAEILKYRITDSRRQDVDSLTPEKLRQLAEQLDLEDFAEKVRTGRAEFNDPIEKSYIKQLQEQRQKAEETLKELIADRDEDNEYIERLVGKKFFEKFESAIKAREDITRKNEELDKAIKTGEKDAARMAWQLQRARANYNTIVESLEELARAQKLEIDVQAALADERVRDAVKATRTETKEVWQGKFDALQEEYRDYRKSAKAEATLTVALARKTTREELKAHINELKQKQKSARELREAKKGVTKRILRSISPRELNADQGRAIAIIQRLVEPSMLEGLDRFIGGIEKPYLRTIFETWKVDEKLRETVLKGKAEVTKEKMQNLLNKAKFEDLTNDDKKYLYLKIPPKDWATALGLESIIKRRAENYLGLNGETEKQIALQYLPPDIYYRIMDKPFSEWTLQEGEELAKIVDDLTIKGKEIYKANIEVERRRIRDYQNAVIKTIRTLRPGTKPDDVEKILGKYDEGVEGTAQAASRRRNMKGPLFGYADMNIYRFTRMLDNGDTNGKNSAALYRGASDAYNAEMTAIDTRTKRVQEHMKSLGITESELWQNKTEIDLGGEFGKKIFTASELLGFISAIRDDYSRAAVMYGNLLHENEKGEFQKQGVKNKDMEPLLELAEERYAKMGAAAQKLIAENPNYLKLLAAIDEDFTAGGQRLSEALTRYNNTFMPMVEHYFPMHRETAVSAQTADAKLARDLMGSSSGGFRVFVEKGFTNKRIEIPAQYQTGIKLDIMGVWAEAVNREEHFIAYGQLVKDLNGIYKQNRQVINAIQNRYGRQAVNYINKYINELANPIQEKTRDGLNDFVKKMRGNTAAAYLSWKASGIIKQFITSPAPFFGYMNPIEYWGTFIEYATHQEQTWKEITDLSEHMEHRSANLLTDIVKEQAKQKFENKLDAGISQFNKRGMEGLEWIDRMCVAPGWLVLFRKEHNRLTRENLHGTLSEKDIRVKAAQYADDITRLTQPSARVDDLSPLFKTNNELGKAILQFTASLNVIWQNIRYDLPQMIRDRRYKNAVGTIMGYTIAGIILGAICSGFDDDDDEAMKAKKLAWWATTQFTDAFPVLGTEATHFAELLITGKTSRSSGLNFIPAFEKGYKALQAGTKSFQQKDFDKMLKATALAAEAAGIYKGLPVSGIKELEALLGIGDGDGKVNIHPGAVFGRR